jgi:hypothetical protein
LEQIELLVVRYMSLVGIGSAIAPCLGEWAMVAVAGAIVECIRDQFDSNEMLRLKQVISGNAQLNVR